MREERRVSIRRLYQCYKMAPIPIYVKGGVWTNVEDQILKAAVQKYGTHQWSKVASLLQKKTARQSELRWNEYLNPHLNFTEFSKQDDAKLAFGSRKRAT